MPLLFDKISAESSEVYPYALDFESLFLVDCTRFVEVKRVLEFGGIMTLFF